MNDKRIKFLNNTMMKQISEKATNVPDEPDVRKNSDTRTPVEDNRNPVTIQNHQTDRTRESELSARAEKNISIMRRMINERQKQQNLKE